ncbi:hypothetical protein ILUMI_09005 [Ignelater luminosus]|uniref:Spire n=1 Tax=Ignelater luminosus TaxID=2038154 RepID=A0A8K0GCW2_IGNLU|nr:hypothetical protein ILUMI_09005 [Ignelater luminosus]
MSTKVRCKLNSDGSVCLRDILESFHSPVREEHAWALCYQCCKFFWGLLGTSSRENCLTLSELNHVFLQTDGNVHPNTFFGGNNATAGSSRKNLADEHEFIRGLGLVMFQALDHGSNNGEERAISHDLEQLISDMISEDRSLPGEPHHETDDEGIEKDSEETDEQPEGIRINVRQVMQRCERHLTVLSKPQVEAHYKAVVRALVTEALELSTFLERVAQGTSGLRSAADGSSTSDLDQLQFADWARFWVQVIAELRMGVKLRKVHYSRAPIEYELTPYEILMKDIRACRYNLRKIMVDGDIPYKVTKDAHAIILEFIRSRPPLKKASDRKLPPQPKNLTPREQLMNSIRKGRPLRPTRNVPRFQLEVSGDESSTKPQTTRKLIKVDFSQLDDEEDDDDEPLQTDNSSESEGPGLWPNEEYHQLCNASLEAYDLATQDLELRHTTRRHTLGVIEQPWGSQSVPQSRPCSRQSCNSSEAESFPPEMTRSLQDHLIGNGKCWPEGMSLEDRLSLTLEEIVHIRSVLTKADLEALPVEGRVRGDVESRKVCFVCLKTRFGIFGPWGQRCIICKRTVCSRCYSKMNIPMEHFAGVPVALLSPSLLATPEDDHRSDSRGSSRVTPEPESEGGPLGSDHQVSPNSIDRSPGSTLTSGQEGETSAMRRFKTKANAVGKAAGVVDKLKGSQLVVCHDCKMMLQQIIESARTNRTAIRNKTLQNLSLNLSPVF